MKTNTVVQAIVLILCTLLMNVPSYAGGKETVTYYHHDALGSVVAATNEQGQVIWREEYKPLGARMVKDTASQHHRVWYTGHTEEQALGLVYMGARWYHPEIGQFLSIDPVGFNEENPQSFNRYAYANQNPYKYVDPDGRDIVFAPGTSSKFMIQTAQAIAYLNSVGSAENINKINADHNVKVTLKEGKSWSAKGNKYSPGRDEVTWIPLRGLKTDSGIQSPAMQLGHEFEHAAKDLYGKMDLTANKKYDTNEEERVITGWETSTAKKLGEPSRDNHGGSDVKVGCPTCRKAR